MANKPFILCVNPWIYDFAAYDFWIKPLGLLYVARFLMQHGFECGLVDCLDTRISTDTDSSVLTRNTPLYNAGKFPSEIIEKPSIVQHIPRHYKRYGISLDTFKNRVLSFPKPSVILLTCTMTYWYPAAVAAAQILKSLYPDVAIVLGGIYVRLCSRHAASLPYIDYVLSDNSDSHIMDLICRMCGCVHVSHALFDIATMDRPAYDLYPYLRSAATATSFGCPYTCAYCSSHIMYPTFTQRSVDSVIQEFTYYAEREVEDVAFYDDALLLHARSHIIPILETSLKRGFSFRFHTPNGLHVREIDDAVAELLFASQFKTLRLSFESSNAKRQADSSFKVSNDDFARAYTALRKAGFQNEDIGVYMLIGLPGQTREEIEASAQFLAGHTVMIKTAQYSPIPGTAYYKQYQKTLSSQEDDPLLHNRAVFPLADHSISYEEYQDIKNYIRSLNNASRSSKTT